MNRAYKARISESRARLEAMLIADAKRFGHHGAKDFIEIVRQRHNAAITEEYARELLARAA